ncbi:MAG: asparaginase, partial [Lachnospiraceae bacterium]|nr:asparaginase [Lachnospiraceae bacterium]
MGSKVLIINTGGTLSSVARQHGLAPGLTTDSMLKELHIVAGEAELSTLEFSSLDSANIFPEDWAELARLISENRKRADGIVVIHGTDTLAYTSSMLSFMLQNIQIPVVITGSQLSISNPVADAMENLRCAIYMAQSGCPGVFVAFNRKVMLGCRASKVRSLSFDAFDSINCENVATLSSIGMKINKHVLPKRSGVFRLQNRYCQEVAVLKLFPGMHREVLKMYAD